MMKMSLERHAVCYYQDAHAQFEPILFCIVKSIVHNVKSIIKYDKNVLKPETILQKRNHQDAKWCIQNTNNHIS